MILMLQSGYSKYLNKVEQGDIVPTHEMKSKLFKEDYIHINTHKTELANFGSSDSPTDLQGLDVRTISGINDLVPRNPQLLLKISET